MTIIACLSPYSADQVRELAGTDDLEVRVVPPGPDPEAVRAAVLDVDIIISDATHKHHLDRETLMLSKGCRLIQQPAVGFDVIDHRAAAEFGIPVANAAGFNADTVADWTVMGMLNVVRSGARADQEMRGGGWRPGDLHGRDMRALTVGVVGMGNIGQQVAARLLGFGSRVLYYDVITRDIPGCKAVSLDELLQSSDIVTVHVPLDATAKAVIGEAEIARMRQGAIFCNASRGPVVDEAALVAALASGHLSGAALDVFEVEPLSADSPLRRMDNVFINPHIAGASEEARRNLLVSVSANIRRVLAGEKPINVVNGV